jgi:glycosyltransferase involved in cell wall biosynthesis
MLANFAYAPNVDAAGHLAGEIMPRLRRAVPDVQLWLVGNEPPAEIRALADRRVRVTGRVDDVVPYLDAADVVVVPLRIGGGIKVKSIEALRRGKAIVSTTIGAQGMPPASDGAMVIADSAHAFAEGVGRVLGDSRLRARLERCAAVAARELPSWDDAADAVASAYERLAAGVVYERLALGASPSEVLSVAGGSG